MVKTIIPQNIGNCIKSKKTFKPASSFKVENVNATNVILSEILMNSIHLNLLDKCFETTVDKTNVLDTKHHSATAHKLYVRSLLLIRSTTKS